ncbi:MAG: lysoplasmalogenase family protein [Candidatus Thorarchaeota archaeon]|jgi:hypothetical protein
MSNSFKSPIGIVRLLLILAILATVVLVQVFVGQFDPNWIFLSGSAMVVVLAFVNFLERRDDTAWSRFVLLMFIAMLVCFLADLLMARVFYIIPGESLINGVLFFAMGHVIYLIALRNRSPLLLKNESPKLITRNLILWIVSIAVVFVLFFVTLYDPAQMVISIGLFGYGILLTSSLVFSLTKISDVIPQLFGICLTIGFLFFFISDYILGYRILTDPSFLDGIEAVGITYLLGQMIIHLSPLFSSKQ